MSLGCRWREICESSMYSGNCNTLSKRAIWHFLEDKPLHVMGILHYKGFLCPNHCRKVLERPWVWKGHVIREDGCLSSNLWDRWMMIKVLTICKLSELWHNSRRRRNYTNDRFRILCQFNWMETQKQHNWFTGSEDTPCFLHMWYCGQRFKFAVDAQCSAFSKWTIKY